MTLVIRAGFNGRPLLFGDLLLTMENPRTPLTSLPLMEDISLDFIEGLPYQPVELCQKLICEPNLTFGWSSDDARLVRPIVAAILNRNRLERFTPETLVEYVNDFPEVCNDVVQFVGYLLFEDQVFPFVTGSRDKLVRAKHFHTVAIIGSGGEAGLRALDGLQLDSTKWSDGERTDVGTTFGSALAVAGTLLCVELATVRNLAEFYGGGYEFVERGPNGFRKVDDVTHMFWRATKAVDKVTIEESPFRVCKFGYTNDLLVAKSARIDVSENVRRFACKLYGVPPIERSPSLDEWKSSKVPKFASRVVCNYFFINPKEKLEVMMVLRMNKTAEDVKGISFSEDTPERLELSIEPQFFLNVAEQIASNESLSTSSTQESS